MEHVNWVIVYAYTESFLTDLLMFSMFLLVTFVRVHVTFLEEV